MPSNDIELFQSFCRTYFNKAVNAHFTDISGNTDSDLSISNSRETIKRVCLHKNEDPIILTVARLLIWWIETRGLFDEIIYGIPSTTFHESNVFKPQIAIYWRESKDDAKTNDRYPIRARYTVRWKGAYATAADINAIRIKINSIFNAPAIHSFQKGANKYSYRDKVKGYELIVSANDLDNAKKVINSLLEIQNDNPLTSSYLKVSNHAETLTEETTLSVQVGGQTYPLPTRNPVGTVYFTHAEFKVHGMTRDILLTDYLGVNLPTSSSESASGS